MAKTRAQKEEAVNLLTEKLQNAKSAAFSSARGLTVVQMEDLRKQCRAEEIEFVSVKKTLLKLALSNMGIEKDDFSAFDGIVAVAISATDEVAPARVLKTFGKDHEALKMHDGVLEGAYADEVAVKALADLPGRDELRAKFVGALQGPIYGFNNVLAANLRGFVQVLDQVREQKAA
jgi:large subunit ribosomal protein L10